MHEKAIENKILKRIILKFFLYYIFIYGNSKDYFKSYNIRYFTNYKQKCNQKKLSYHHLIGKKYLKICFLLVK